MANKTRVATLNLLNHPYYRWERLRLAIDGIKRLNPDVVFLQEVSLATGVSDRLNKSFPGYHLSLCPRGGKLADIEAVAILSKQKPLHKTCLHLSQNRVAQSITLDIGGTRVDFTNLHLYFSVLTDKPRQKQVKEAMEFIQNSSVVAGDLNAMPSQGSIKLLKQRFLSAFDKANGTELAWTCPTPLSYGRKPSDILRRWGLKSASLSGIKVQRPVDYIFVAKNVRVDSCRVVFDDPSNDGLKLYASDHLGLVAELMLPS